MAYLTADELTTYCSMPGVTLQDVLQASTLIDSYRGQSFLQKTYTEQVILKKKRQGYLMASRGKLEHYPRTSIVSVTAEEPIYYDGTREVTYDISSLRFDADDSPYFEFRDTSVGTCLPYPKFQPLVLAVKYTAGYAVVPEVLKVITGLLCDNAKMNGGFRMYKSRQDYDMTVAFSDKEDAVLTNNICRMIDSIPLA